MAPGMGEVRGADAPEAARPVSHFFAGFTAHRQATVRTAVMQIRMCSPAPPTWNPQSPAHIVTPQNESIKQTAGRHPEPRACRAT